MADLHDDIDRYLKGDLSPAEMHAMEKRALDDPFLADALEGLSPLDTPKLDADLAKLRIALEHRVAPNGGKIVPFWLWPARIAAGLLILVAATVLVISLSRDKPAGPLAINQEITEPSEDSRSPVPFATDSLATPEFDQSREQSAVGATPPVARPAPQKQAEEKASAPEEVDVLSGFSSAAAGQKAENPGQAKAADEDSELAKTESENRREVIVADSPIASEDLQKARAKKSDVKTLQQIPASESRAPAEAAAGRLEAKDALTRRVIKGQVKSEDGIGLPGVNVMIKDSNFGTVTDLSGNYQIAATAEPTTLVFSFIGFASEEVDATEKSQVDVSLGQDVSELSEVVVVGYGAERPTDDALFSNLEFAAPEGGQRAYKQYLENSLRYPEQALKNSIEGKVTIQFTVETTGKLSDFNVIRGIGHGCDEEVIRLVREGPGWTPTRRNNASLRDKVKVRVKFSLPKK